MTPRNAVVCGLAGFALILSACGKDMTRATGEVTVDGKPLDIGQITFSPMEGASAGAHSTVIADGTFSIDVALGKNRVNIFAPPRFTSTDGKSPGVGGKARVPARYNSQSPLTAEVKPGQANHFKFDLKSD